MTASYTPYLVFFHSVFFTMLDDHQAFFLSKDQSPEWVYSWRVKVMQRALSLSIFPLWYRKIRWNIHAIRCNKKYNILYQVNEDTRNVRVFACVHESWSLESFFNQLEDDEYSPPPSSV